MISSSHLSLSDRLRIWLAKWMVRFGRLTHDVFTIDELDALIAPHLPYTHTLTLPIGKGQITLSNGKVALNNRKNRVEVHTRGNLKIEVLGVPMYRAHILFVISAHPSYDSKAKVIRATEVTADDIRLIKDDYTFVQDADTILGKLLPLPGASRLTKPMRSMMNLATAGLSEDAISYLNLFIKGNTQQVLNYHLPQLDQLFSTMAKNDAFAYPLDNTQWREVLFMQLGKDIVDQDNELRFRF